MHTHHSVYVCLQEKQLGAEADNRRVRRLQALKATAKNGKSENKRGIASGFANQSKFTNMVKKDTHMTGINAIDEVGRVGEGGVCVCVEVVCVLVAMRRPVIHFSLSLFTYYLHTHTHTHTHTCR
jgi:hypothetical protein